MRKLSFLIVFILLAACTSQPLYAPAAGPNQAGYTETRLGDNRFRVGFTGRRETTSDQVKNFAMLRAAEVTVLYGYDWFKIISSDNNIANPRTEPRVSIGVGVGTGCRPYGCGVLGSRWYTGARVDNFYDSERHHTSLEILLGKGEPDNPQEVYNAEELLKYLRASSG